MYLYRFTNLINGKKYIGITNNAKRRYNEHKGNHNPKALISQAIKKYGIENFKFEILHSNLSIDQACELEIEYIKKENSLVPNGYNVDKGGINPKIGTANGRSKLTEEEVQYIKDHRDQPLYVLYEEFNDKIGYGAFKKIYYHQTYENILPHVAPYPFNLEFSNQFTSNNKLDYDEVIELRKLFAQRVPWREAYTEKYQKLYPIEIDFWKVYIGDNYKLVMPEVITEENKHFQASISHSGENNGRSKLTKEDVKKIRELHNQGISNSEIYKLYSKVTPASIRNIIAYKTWKHIS